MRLGYCSVVGTHALQMRCHGFPSAPITHIHTHLHLCLNTYLDFRFSSNTKFSLTVLPSLLCLVLVMCLKFGQWGQSRNIWVNSWELPGYLSRKETAGILYWLILNRSKQWWFVLSDLQGSWGSWVPCVPQAQAEGWLLIGRNLSSGSREREEGAEPCRLLRAWVWNGDNGLCLLVLTQSAPMSWSRDRYPIHDGFRPRIRSEQWGGDWNNSQL